MAYDIARRRGLAGKLKAARQDMGISAADAAAMISAFGIQCLPGTLLAWERGSGGCAREPFASDLAVIAMVYRRSVDELYPASQTAAISLPLETPGMVERAGNVGTNPRTAAVNETP